MPFPALGLLPHRSGLDVGWGFPPTSKMVTEGCRAVPSLPPARLREDGAGAPAGAAGRAVPAGGGAAPPAGLRGCGVARGAARGLRLPAGPAAAGAAVAAPCPGSGRGDSFRRERRGKPGAVRLAARSCEAVNCPRSLLAGTVPFLGKVFRLFPEGFRVA